MVNFSTAGIGQLLNSVQSTFVGLLRIWSIPIVLSLSLASGYTTYYGMAHFITPWIALIITVAVQSIVVIGSLELAGMHWRANASRYLATLTALLVALIVSVTFSYFKFYEISQGDTIFIERQNTLRTEVNGFLDEVAARRADILAQQKKRQDAAHREATTAFLGTHPSLPQHYRGRVGKGPVWEHYNRLYQEEQTREQSLNQSFVELDGQVAALRNRVNGFAQGNARNRGDYEAMLDAFQQVQGKVEALAAFYALPTVNAPVLASFEAFNREVEPTFAMWANLSWFALACAAMVDFFAVVLSYKLEFTAPGPLTDEEKKLAWEGLSQFSEFSINRNDELEISIEKTELERARRISDRTRMFVVAMLLSRGYLRKVNQRSVEFAPNLYPVLAEFMGSGETAGEGAPRLLELVRKKVNG
jgi:hypothetical protein